jgi:Tfp pilus assembly protein PilF
MGPDAGQHRESNGDAAADPIKETVRLESALAGKPNDPDLLFAFHRTAEVAARQAFGKIAAGSARAHQVVAEHLTDSGSLAEAEREYQEALRLQPYTSGVRLALGDVLAAEGKWAQAIAQFRGESALRPLHVETLYRLGYALLKNGQPRDAQAALSRADALQQNTPAILLALGQAALAANDAGQAEGSWKKLLAIDGSSELAAQAHLGLASLYRTTGRPADAERETAAYQQLEKKGKL